MSGYSLATVFSNDHHVARFFKTPSGRGALAFTADKMLGLTRECMAYSGVSPQAQEGLKQVHLGVSGFRDLDGLYTYAQKMGGLTDIRASALGVRNKSLSSHKRCAHGATVIEQSAYAIGWGPLKVAMFGKKYFNASYGSVGQKFTSAFTYVAAVKNVAGVAESVFSLLDPGADDATKFKKTLKLAEKGIETTNDALTLVFKHAKRLPPMPGIAKAILPLLAALVSLFAAWQDTA